MPNAAPAVKAARGRRATRAGQEAVRIEWFIKNVSDKVEMSMEQRVKTATEFLRSKVVKNISKPVVKMGGRLGGTIVTERSKPGEFPRADTTQLMKTIFGITTKNRGVFDGYVGTPLDYGLVLEISKPLNRSYLLRTFQEERSKITKILTGPLIGGGRATPG